MKTDTEISYEREKSDYTHWRETLFEDLTIEELSARAMAYVTAQEKREQTLR
jgi:hypothetical protein